MRAKKKEEEEEERSCWIDRMKRSAKEKRGCAIWMELSERGRRRRRRKEDTGAGV